MPTHPPLRTTATLTRRQLIQAGALGSFGLRLPGLFASESGTDKPPRAKSCILLYMWGGPSHIDTWDPKPDAPAEVRGEFNPIDTTVPGLRISEHFPRLAQLAREYTVVRSMTHNDPAHLSNVHHLMTGRLAPVPNSDAAPATRGDSPCMGAVLAQRKPSHGLMPTSVTLPWKVSHPAAPGGTAPGQHAGWLGSAFDPFVVTGDPNSPDFRVAGVGSTTPDVGDGRLIGRGDLLRRLDSRGLDADFSGFRQKALDMVLSPEVRRAFDLSKEPPNVRDRYGRHTHGQSCLMARRLVESGVRLVTVNWPDDGQAFWDTHGNNFPSLKTRLMPPADEGFSALLEDLSRRGLLDETLVVWVGEFGRTPTVENGGRQHWPQCYSAVLAGAGIRKGFVYGSSDRLGAMPGENPVSPPDLTATIYASLGVPTDTILHDPLGRPHPLTEGRMVTELFA